MLGYMECEGYTEHPKGCNISWDTIFHGIKISCDKVRQV